MSAQHGAATRSKLAALSNLRTCVCSVKEGLEAENGVAMDDAVGTFNPQKRLPCPVRLVALVAAHVMTFSLLIAISFRVLCCFLHSQTAIRVWR
jgi:hypothetical protein